MIDHITTVSMRLRMLVIGAAALAMGLGAAQLSSASVDALPEFGPPQVQIQTEALGLSAAEVEQLITVPMEQTLFNGIPWLDQIRSESAPGISSIELIFQAGTDPLKARQVVQERMTRVRTLPNVGTPPVIIQPLSSTSRVMMIALSSADLSLIDLSVLARWKIKPRLMGVPGVANVTIWGERNRQLQVQVDPDRLRQNGVTLNQVIFTTGNALWVSPLTYIQSSTPGTGGFIDTDSQRLTIQHVLPIKTAGELSSVTVEGTGGRTIRLGQVATVVEDHQPLIGDAILSTGPGLMLVVQKLPQADTLEVAKGVRQALDALRPGLSGVAIDTSVYQADAYLQTSLVNLGRWAVAGLVLLFVLLALVLSWRLAVVSIFSTLLSLLAAAYVLYVSGATLNMMAVAGLALALVVVISDAVVVSSSVRRSLHEQGASGGASSAMAVVSEATRSMRGPLGYATLIVLIVPIPALFLDGVAGSFAKQAIVAYVLAVLCSTVVTMTVAPAMALLLLPKTPLESRWSPFGRWSLSVLEKGLRQYTRRPRWAYVTLAVLLLVGCTAIPQIGARSLIPEPQDRTLLISLETTPGTSLPEMRRVTSMIMRDLRAVSGVRLVGGHIGRAVTGDQFVNVNAGELWVGLAESAKYKATVAAIGKVLRAHTEVNSELLTYEENQLRAVQAGRDDDVVVRVYGPDLDVLRSEAETMLALIATIPGIDRPALQLQREEPTIEVKVDLAAAQHFGLNPGDVRRAAATYYAGLLVGNLYEEQKVFDVVVRGSPTKLSTPDIGTLLIDTPRGAQVPLSRLASVKVVPSPTVIRHDATSRSLDVTAEVSGRDLSSVLAEVKRRIHGMSMPLEYHVEVLSGAALRQGQEVRVASLAIAVGLVIFLLLQAAFASWRLATLVFITAPLAAAGGVISAPIAGGLMSLGALLGLFIVLALSLRNGILLVRHLQRLDSVESAPDRSELVIRATRDSCAAILLVVAATCAVLLPLPFLGSSAGTELLYPLAVVVLGGLVTSTFVTLFLTPALYLRLTPAAETDSPRSESVVGAGARRARDSRLRPTAGG